MVKAAVFMTYQSQDKDRRHSTSIHHFYEGETILDVTEAVAETAGFCDPVS